MKADDETIEKSARYSNFHIANSLSVDERVDIALKRITSIIGHSLSGKIHR